MSILIVGDAMLDRHVYGDTERISPEAPVPVVKWQDSEWALGAAANVAAHVSSAGEDCFFAFKFDGKYRDDHPRTFQEKCTARGIMLRPLLMDLCPLTVKTRVWSNGQQVCRIDQENTDVPSDALQKRWIAQLTDIVDNHEIDVVVFSDYDKGALTDNIIWEVSHHCRKRGVPTILDPKRPSFYELSKVDVIKPNRLELKSTNMLADECSAKLGADTWLVNTLGAEGMVVYRGGVEELRCPTVAEEVVDVCGCGDTVTALLALAMREGFEIASAVEAANKGASLTIKHKGCYVPTREEIEKCLR